LHPAKVDVPGPMTDDSLDHVALREPGWVSDVVWWHVYPLGFSGADVTGVDQRPSRGLAHVTAWLDYAVELGVSGIALGPIFQSLTHGYDTINHFRIDPRLGARSDFDELVAAAHHRGLRLLLDGVFNHVARDFPAFLRALSDRPGSEAATWFQLHQPDGNTANEPNFATFEGHRELVVLNHDNPAVADYVAEVMLYWLGQGADGWRLDAAYAVPLRFWHEVLPRVTAVNPEAYLVGEVIHGDYSAIVTESGLASVTQYELWKAIWSSLNDRNLFELAWALGRHNAYLDTFVPLTFIGNHDVTRLASKLVDDRHLPLALVVLLTTGGTPSIYYGDEQAFRGVKEERVGGDDVIRPPYPGGPADLAPDGWPTYRLHQDLIRLRRSHPWLHTARTDVVQLTNQQFVYRAVGHGNRLIVALNVADTGTQHDFGGTIEIVAASPGASADGGRLVVPAHGWVVAQP
jgi:cyclomaltodextrinase / maltogenic alpha-amylase / neopullulanase